MNSDLKKAFAKVGELPREMQRSVAKALIDKVDKWQRLRRDVLGGFASGPSEPWNASELKAEGRQRRLARHGRKKAATHARR